MLRFLFKKFPRGDHLPGQFTFQGVQSHSYNYFLIYFCQLA